MHSNAANREEFRGVDAPAPDQSGRWYVVKTQPRKERLARLHLERQGFETFLPEIAPRLRARRTQRSPNPTPLFPGYLFVRLDLAAQRWRAVNSTVGVLYLVSFGARPSPMPIGVTEHLQSRVDENGVYRHDRALAPGDRVRVIGGPLDDMIGEIERRNGSGRVAVLMQLMNATLTVIMTEGDVIKTDA